MNSYRRVAQNEEIDSIVLCNQIIDRIFDEMDKIVGIKSLVEEFHSNYPTFMRLILVDPSLAKFRPLLLYLLKKYSINEYALLWNYANAFANAPQVLIQSLVGELNKCCIWDGLSYDGYLFTAATHRGKLELMNVDRWLAFSRGFLLKNNVYNGHCHEAVWNLAPYFEDFNAKVVKIPTLFGGGSFFHSYFEKDGTVLDFATNAAVVNDSFSTVMSPEIVFSCSAGELYDRYDFLCQTDSEVPKSMCAVLSLAINEIKKGR